MRTRSIRIGVWLNERERDHLCRQAKKSGLSKEGLIRTLIMELDVKPAPTEEVCQLRHQVQAIGNNINQIARIANGLGTIDTESIDEIVAMQQKIWQRVKAI